MSYVSGFVVPVPTDKKDAYLEMAEKACVLFREFGATRVVECWGEDVPDGEATDFRGAVKADPAENVVFSWIEWPDRETCKAAEQRMKEDERMQAFVDMPFDGKRMIWGGFEPILDR